MTRSAVVFLLGIKLLLLGAAGASAADEIKFSRDIRPIFVEKCYACHGPDKNKRKSKLR